MRGGPGHQHAHARHLGSSPYRLLRLRRERPRGRRAAKQRDELAAFQLIEEHSVPFLQALPERAHLRRGVIQARRF
jgi:hypothetical protein